jgi:hypothetical protein
MGETQESEWAPAAYSAREERRHRAAIAPGSDWTLQAFAARDLDRRRRERLEARVATTTPDLSPTPARESARHLQPILQTDWTLSAFQGREAQRQRLEAVARAPDDDRPRRAGPLLTSDWTLPAFRARELERARQEAREAAARTPVLQEALRPFLRAAATQAAARPGSSPPPPPRPAQTQAFFRHFPPAATATSEFESRAVSSDQPAPPATLDPVMADALEVRLESAATRRPEVEEGTLRDGRAAIPRRLAYGLGAFAMLGLGVFLLRLPAAKAPATTPAQKAQPARRPPSVQEQAQKRVAPRIRPAESVTPAPAPPVPAMQTPAAQKPAAPLTRESLEATPLQAPPAASNRPAELGPPAKLPLAPAPARSETKSAPASPVSAPKPKGDRPTVRPPSARAKPQRDTTQPTASTPTAPTPSTPQPETEGQRPETWFERLTESVRNVGQSARP